MAKINVLPKSVAELIAAGEVVERPASVIKELVENSIDAGAKNISVEIKGGGIRYIRVTDDGCGIAREDVRTAFISHATSKISTSEDLDSVFTLGFRGEALPSIAAVSRLSLLSRTEQEETGTEYVIEGGEEVSLDDAGCPVGTTIVIRDIFYNTPARMKFLKRDVTEGTYAADVVTKCAVSHPDIRFSFVRDGKSVLSTPGDGDLYNAVYSAFGKETAEALIPCEYEYNSITVHGFISRPLNNRPNRNLQYFFVNGRFVRIPAAAPALDEAYKNRIMVGKFPMCFLSIGIPADKIDVNVHPAKTEIRFSDERAVFEVIFYAARSALNKGDTLRPEIRLGEKRDILSKPLPQTEQLGMSAKPILNRPELISETVLTEKNPLTDKRFSASLLKDPDAAKPPEKDAKQPAIVPAKETVPEEPEKTDTPAEEKRDPVPENNRPSPFMSAYLERMKEESGMKSVQTEKDASPAVFRQPPEPRPAAPVPRHNIDILCDEPDFRIIGEVFKTYIIAERGNKLLLIDKHAAHERMLFNALKKRCGSEGSQLLLLPVSVSLSAGEYAAVLDNIEVFSKAGYAVEDFGGGSVIVRECPVELAREDISAVVAEMAGELLKGNMRPVPEKLDWLYHSTACRAAVKAGDRLDPKEMESFVERLLSDDSILYCPHGRPVLFELSRSELEKQFGRSG